MLATQNFSGVSQFWYLTEIDDSTKFFIRKKKKIIFLYSHMKSDFI